MLSEDTLSGFSLSGVFAQINRALVFERSLSEVVGNVEEILIVSCIIERATPGLDGLTEETEAIVDAPELEIADTDRVTDDSLLELLDFGVLLFDLKLIYIALVLLESCKKFN